MGVEMEQMLMECGKSLERHPELEEEKKLSDSCAEHIRIDIP